RPLIVTDVPGNRHFVRDGIEGLLVPPDDVGALSSALASLAGDPDRRCQMGQAARRRLLEGFTEQHVRSTLRASYAAMLAGDGEG
ncbi:MAG TPA: glycosyltransferase, partial [Hyphomicrobiaceae bacterium]|nr:glycosyltransferase [Hyphomicrobiaceae bacterium]